MIRWNPSLGDYDFFWRANNNGNPEWRHFTNVFEAATETLAPGEAFWIANNQSSVQYFYAMGELPDQSTLPTSQVTLAQGFSQSAYSYPSGIGINDTTLSNGVVGGFFGDTVARWDPDSGQYRLYFYDDTGDFGGGWQDFNGRIFLQTHHQRSHLDRSQAVYGAVIEFSPYSAVGPNVQRSTPNFEVVKEQKLHAVRAQRARVKFGEDS